MGVRVKKLVGPVGVKVYAAGLYVDKAAAAKRLASFKGHKGGSKKLFDAVRACVRGRARFALPALLLCRGTDMSIHMVHPSIHGHGRWSRRPSTRSSSSRWPAR